MEDKPKILYECDCKACERCNYLQCAATTKIEHARNFVKIGNDYWEKNSIDCFNLPHQHLCEIKLFHEKDKRYWKKYCPRGKKPNKKFWAGMEDICDNCEHSITIDFYDDDNRECVKARRIYRTGD